MIPVQSVTLEGPDCSGKTTLYRLIHKRTGFLWNIHDRSNLSMVCYARQYGRSDRQHRVNLMKDILTLNNLTVILLPPESTLEARLAKRKDEFQNADTIKDLRRIFAEESSAIEKIPTVKVIREDLSPDMLAEEVIGWVKSFDKSKSMTPVDVGRLVRDTVVGSSLRRSTIRVAVNIPLDREIDMLLDHPREGQYYRKIFDDIVSIFSHEFAGNNLYGVPQDLSSRRLYYSSSSCISSVHFLVENGLLKVLATLRSTDVHRNASIDTQFLCALCKEIANHYQIPVKNIILDITFNCAHVRDDLPTWDKNEVHE